MAAKTLQRLQLLRQVGTLLCSSRPAIVGPRQSVCAVCVWTSAHRCLLRQGCRRLSVEPSQMGVCTTARDPLFLSVSGSVRLYRDSPGNGGLSFLHPLSDNKEKAFAMRLASCTSSQQVLRLLGSSMLFSGSIAAGVLHRLADLERDGEGGLRNPAVLSDPGLRALCQRLEQDSGQLDDKVVVWALLGATRLYLDPWSQLVVRLLSESQARLDGGKLSVGTLCWLARALLVLEGPDSGVLLQAMMQLKDRDPALWGTDELRDVYCALASGVGEDGRHQELLNAVNTQALSLVPKLSPEMVSEVMGALVTLDQKQAVPLAIALCKQAVRHMGNFSDGELVTVLDALMYYGHSDTFLIEQLERHMPKLAFIAHPETITKVMQYFSQRRVLSPVAFDAVAESFVYRADEYTTGQVARQIAALGVLGYVPANAGALFRKVESVLHARFSQFQPQALLSLLHACTLLQRHPLNFVSRVFNPYFLQQLQDEGRGMDHVVLAQLTQLYMSVKLECPFYSGPKLLPKVRVKSFLSPRRALETPMDPRLYQSVKAGLVHLLGKRSCFASRVPTPYRYTLDVEIKMDEEGFVLPASRMEDVHKRIALCIDGPKRFAANAQHLLGKEAIKQRHLEILGFQVVQIPYFEFENLKSKAETVEYLHKKVFPHSYRLSW